MKARLEQAVGPTSTEQLRAEMARLTREIERLKQENMDLRESAEIWIRLYENQLSRANRAADLLAHCANALASR